MEAKINTLVAERDESDMFLRKKEAVMPATQRTANVTVLLGVLVLVWQPGVAAQDTTGVNAKTWVGREAEIEEFLKTADILGLEDIPVGVTNPKSVNLAPGGPVDKFAWKPLQPGVRRGYHESYKAEIAAYELDKLLGLGMVPVTVERRIRGDVGAAVMWLSPTQSFKELGGTPTPPTCHLSYWAIQLIRAKMFDTLIYNRDPNEGNWLVDPAWNLMLIDHSRSFTPGDDMAHENMLRVDRYLWERMQQLDEPVLTAALGKWLDDGEIRAILARRDRMGEIIDALVEENGQAAVLLRYGLRPGAVTPSRPTPGREATPAPAPALVDNDLINSLLAAVSEAPLIAPSSELTWRGTVVALDGYRGPYAHIAEAGLRAGHALGLLAGDEGLLCLTVSARDLAPYQRLRGLVGRDVQIFGVLADGTDMPVVQVTVSRIS